jgi:hypothetical protein
MKITIEIILNVLLNILIIEFLIDLVGGISNKEHLVLLIVCPIIAVLISSPYRGNKKRED